ncbi:MAG: uroporphyrinogen decarboxylase family protein [Chloroflexota bacterium]
MTTDLERLVACMDYRPADRRPNHELGVWAQTRQRWQRENPAAVADFGWNWFYEEPGLGLDRRDYVDIYYGFVPPYEHQVLEETDAYEVVRNAKGVVTKALKEGTVDGMRMCMDQYIAFPLQGPADWPDIQARLAPALPERYPADLEARSVAWRARDCPLVLGRNCAANGFYWRARELMGTEQLSYAWYDEPALMHQVMGAYADLVIETSRPVLERVQVDYFTFNEDLSMKNGPLLSPATFRQFIFPHLKRVVTFMRDHGVPHVAVDTDGDPTVLISLFMDAGIDTLWPLERAADVDPVALRRRFGRALRLWGGVDKRVLAQGPAAIRAHLRELIPLIEEGGYIPTVDHTVPPDVSWDDFRYYMDAKQHLLCGEFGRLA